MIYHRSSILGYLLWLRYALLSESPPRGLDEIYSSHLESKGTKAYSRDQAYKLFSSYGDVDVRTQLSFADLLQGAAGAGHNELVVGAARRIWPRRTIMRFLAGHGLYLLIWAKKSQEPLE